MSPLELNSFLYYNPLPLSTLNVLYVAIKQEKVIFGLVFLAVPVLSASISASFSTFYSDCSIRYHMHGMISRVNH